MKETMRNRVRVGRDGNKGIDGGGGETVTKKERERKWKRYS